LLLSYWMQTPNMTSSYSFICWWIYCK